MTFSIRASRLTLVLSTLVFSSVITSPAGADDKPESGGDQAADAAFQAGRELLRAGRVEEACAKFEESERISPSSGTMANLGNCNEKLGHMATAFHDYEETMRLARSENRAKRVEQAQQLLDEVKPKLAVIVLVLPTTVIASDLTVTLDGKPVADVAKPIPLDPGPHTLDVRSAPYEPWQTKVTPGGPGSSLDVHIGPLTPVGQGAPAVTPPAPVTGDEGAADPGHGRRVTGLVVGSAGIVLVAVGGVFGGLAIGDWSSAKNNGCNSDGGCKTQAGVDMVNSARSKGTIAWVGMGVGVAAIAAGGILYFTAPSAAQPEATGLRVVPAIGPQVVGVSIGGAF